ncbi:MAG: hypothetical protein ACUVRD_04695 [Bacteroidia bacterium]
MRVQLFTWSCLGLSLIRAQSWDTLLVPAPSQLSLPGLLLPNGIQMSPALPFRYDTSQHKLYFLAPAESLRLKFSYIPYSPVGALYKPLPWDTLLQWDTLPFMPAKRDTPDNKLKRQGSWVRSLTVGSGQSASLTSALRLNLEGEIAPNTYLLAALSDENIPFQPSGTTQQLSDLDKVYISLRLPGRWQVAIGDLELVERQTLFANYYRNVLGLEVWRQDSLWDVGGAFSQAKGRFYTNSFTGEEGKQGPYLLTGRNGERFTIILAGSERVWVNGQLMERGLDRDYTIEYNTGELTFTPRVPITQATRIVVDFEYAERSYARSFWQFKTRFQGKRFTYRAGYFRARDNPNRPFDFVLSEREKAQLSLLSGGIGVLEGADSVGYEPQAIRYAALDTFENGNPLRIFVFRRDSSAVYQVQFLFVGAGRGDYTRQSSSLNGNVFTWVGRGKGDYVVGKAVPLPTQTEILFMQSTVFLGGGWRWQSEIDLSRNATNLFSAQRTTDWATRQSLIWRVGADSSAHRGEVEMAFQYVGNRYQPVDRLYTREYGRLWNYDETRARQVERLFEIKPRFIWGSHVWEAHAGVRSYGDSLLSQRYAVRWSRADTIKGLGGNLLGEYLPTTTSQWVRLTGDVFWQWHNWRLGNQTWLEKRTQKDRDTLSPNTFSFYDLTPYVVWKKEKMFFRTGINYRREWQWAAQALRLKFFSYTPSMQFRYTSLRWSWLQELSYRVFVPGDTLFQQQAKRIFLQQTQTQYSFSWGNIQAAYQITSELTPKRQLLYVEVNPGLGQYEWQDKNQDGLQQLDEFIPATNPLRANFIRVLRPTSSFIPTIAKVFGGGLRLVPAKISWFSTQSTFRWEEKQNAPDNRFRRYLLHTRWDSTFVSSVIQSRNDFLLFRQRQWGDITYSFIYNQNTQFLNSGFQRTISQTHREVCRLNLSQRVSLELTVQQQNKFSSAQLMSELNYQLRLYEGGGLWQWQARRNLRWHVGYTYRLFVLPTQKIPSHKISLESRLNWAKQATLISRVEAIRLGIKESFPSAALAFEIQEGFQPGNNLWLNLIWNQPLGAFLDVNLVYDGRFSQRKPIHTLRMQLRANF